ncbi:MAG: glycosyltransferase like 2 family protein, partial [Parcubacteria group bacterium]|nr:glycosyltransferase like 2 family protein [Parcubacteria group bacterium]
MKSISCVICAYNEVDRIRIILDVVTVHPLLTEVIVVNDGSTDATLALLAHYPSIRVVSYAPNRGKTYALGRGIREATGELIMLLDADLTGITAEDISTLAAPVLEERADVSFSLRSNSLWIYRMLGLDFVTGERVLPRPLAQAFMEESEHLPRWGGEVCMNRLLIEQKLSLAVVRWSHVLNVRKYKKLGRLEGMKEEMRMIRDAVSVLTPLGALHQNAQLL